MESGIGILIQRVGAWLKKLISRFRIFKVNKDVLLFTVFLLVAIVFWFSQSFKDRTTVNVEYQLHLINVPKNVIFTSDVPSTVTVTLSGKGFSILQYVMDNTSKVLNVDYSDMSKMGGVLTIDSYIWKKLLARELPSGITYSTITPSMVEIYYSMGEHRQVPVVFSGKVRTSNQYILCGLELRPQYVDIYAPSPQYDTITAVYTEHTVYHDVEDTIDVHLALKKIKGVKMVPDSVDVRACVDLFTSKTIKVPVYCENIPQNKILRTFPLMVDVSFRVSATMFNGISSDDFLVVVDFNKIKPGDSKCKLILRELPEGIYDVRVSPESVDYVIEQQGD